MKVLFAIRDDNNIVDTIVRKYQRDYNKKLIYKEVNNFTAILRELQQKIFQNIYVIFQIRKGLTLQMMLFLILHKIQQVECVIVLLFLIS